MKNIFIFGYRVWLTLGIAVFASTVLPRTAAAQSQFPNATVTSNEKLQSSNLKTLAPANQSPVPGSVATSATALVGASQQSPQATSETKKAQQTQPQQVAQADIDIGRSTRGGSSYVGLAGNIGLNGGESSLGDGNFAVISKVGLSRTLSVRPAAIFGDTTSILLPITYDFAFTAVDDPFSDPLPIAPYVGVGAALTTGDDSEVGFLVSGGIDLPLNEKFTATAAVNAGFFDETDIGLLLGVGYNFR